MHSTRQQQQHQQLNAKCCAALHASGQVLLIHLSNLTGLQVRAADACSNLGPRACVPRMPSCTRAQPSVLPAAWCACACNPGACNPAAAAAASNTHPRAQDNYSKRTMLLLVSDIGTIVMGVTAAFSSGPTKAGLLASRAHACACAHACMHAAAVTVTAAAARPAGWLSVCVRTRARPHAPRRCLRLLLLMLHACGRLSSSASAASMRPAHSSTPARSVCVCMPAATAQQQQQAAAATSGHTEQSLLAAYVIALLR